MDLGVAQGQVAQRPQDLGLLRLRALQEFLPDRGVEKEFRHLHLGAGGRRPGRGRSRSPRLRPPPESPPSAPGGQLVRVSRLTAAMEGRASPRKPRVVRPNRSASAASLLVAWRLRLRGISSGVMPTPSSTTRMSRRPPSSTTTVMVDSPGVQGVFHQLLDRRRRADDDFAGGDLGGHLGVKDTDAAHGFSLALRVCLVYHVP